MTPSRSPATRTPRTLYRWLGLVLTVGLLLGLVRDAWARGGIAARTAYFENVVLMTVLLAIALTFKALRRR